MKLPAQKPLYDIVILKPPPSRSLNAADCSADLIKLRFARRLILLFRILNVAVSSVPVPGSAACRPYPLYLVVGVIDRSAALNLKFLLDYETSAKARSCTIVTDLSKSYRSKMPPGPTERQHVHDFELSFVTVPSEEEHVLDH